ncbi:MAG: pentapeptide repeat-containing protein [Thermomicrobiales bacterium]
MRCADLSSSTLTNADIRDADLSGADLHSSACNGVLFNAGTTLC